MNNAAILWHLTRMCSQELHIPADVTCWWHQSSGLELMDQYYGWNSISLPVCTGRNESFAVLLLKSSFRMEVETAQVAGGIGPVRLGPSRVLILSIKTKDIEFHGLKWFPSVYLYWMFSNLLHFSVRRLLFLSWISFQWFQPPWGPAGATKNMGGSEIDVVGAMPYFLVPMINTCFEKKWNVKWSLPP